MGARVEGKGMLEAKWLLLLATTTGYQTRMFGEAAERLGVKLVFATDRCDQLEDPWWDGAIPVRFHQERSAVDAIASRPRGSSRSMAFLRSAIGRRSSRRSRRTRLGLPGHPPDAARVARDKRQTREWLRSAGLPVPWFLIARRTHAGRRASLRRRGRSWSSPPCCPAAAA